MLTSFIIGATVGVGASLAIAVTIAFGFVWIFTKSPNLWIDQPDNASMEENSGFRAWLTKIRGTCNLGALFIFGFVTVAFLWEWIAEIMHNGHLILLYGIESPMFSSRMAKIVLAFGHLDPYFTGITICYGLIVTMEETSNRIILHSEIIQAE
ncbi:MAG: hypothetical protein ACFFDJ_09985 [Candidatus Odinarchaeota archaeon]